MSTYSTKTTWFIKLFTLVNLIAFNMSANAQWIQTNGPEIGIIQTMVTDGTNLYCGTYYGGVFKSVNSGSTWTHASSGITDSNILCLLVDSIYIFAGTQQGIFRSSDYGNSWTNLTNVIPGNAHVYSLHKLGNEIFASESSIGLLKSTDHGATWTATGTGLLGNQAVNTMEINGTTLFAGYSPGGGYISTNGGNSWSQLNLPTPNGVNSLLVVGSKIFAGKETGGLIVSSNNGGNWQSTSLIAFRIYKLFLHGSNIYAGTNDGVYFSADTGATWNLINTGLQTKYPAISFTSIGTDIWAGTDGEGVFKFDFNTNAWFANNTGLIASRGWTLHSKGSDVFVGTYHGIFYTSDHGNSWTAKSNGINRTLIHSIHSSGTKLYAGTLEGVYNSNDYGNNWTQSNIGLPFQAHSVVSILGDANEVYAGTEGQGVYHSIDSGISWTAANAGITGPSILWVFKFGNNLLIGANFGAYISTNHGSSWAAIDSGLNLASVESICQIGSTLFAGTDFGVYQTVDTGRFWTQINNGLTNTIVQALIAVDSVLIAGTKGGGIFVSYDLGNNWMPQNSGLTNLNIYSLTAAESNIYAGTNGSGVFINSNILTGINEEKKKDLQLSLYPNPLRKENVTLTLDIKAQLADGTIEIYNLLGSLIYSEKNISVGKKQINLPNVIPGIYILKVGNGNYVSSKKLIVQ